MKPKQQKSDYFQSKNVLYLYTVPYCCGRPSVVWCWPKSAVSYFPSWKLPNTHMIATIKECRVVNMSGPVNNSNSTIQGVSDCPNLLAWLITKHSSSTNQIPGTLQLLPSSKKSVCVRDKQFIMRENKKLLLKTLVTWLIIRYYISLDAKVVSSKCGQAKSSQAFKVRTSFVSPGSKHYI